MTNEENGPIGIKELARVLGLSTGTVSRSLNNRYGVNHETRAKVLEAARVRGYVPNASARRLKEHPVLNIGLFFAPFITANHRINPAALHRLKEFHNEAAAAGMSLQVVFYNDDQQLLAQVAKNHMNCAIFYGHFPPSTFRAVHDFGLPAMVLDAHTEFSDQISVISDTCHAGYAAVQYLAALGHERIGLVCGPISDLHGASYLKGFRQALSEFGLPCREDWIFPLAIAVANKDGARASLLPMLRQADRPGAIVSASDWLTLGVRQAAKDAGLRLPQDLSIVSYDNLPIAGELEPPLTTFDIDIPRLARILVRLAGQIIQRRGNGAGGQHREILLRPNLIKRQSCCCLRKTPSFP